MGTVSIVIPALNEEQAIEKVICAIPKENLKRMGFDVQILVVDNGSEDATGALAKKAGADVIFEPRRGYGRAYKTGFVNVKGDIIATVDADSTYPVEDIPEFVSLLETQELDFITTNRFARIDDGAMSCRNKLGNKALNLVFSLLFRVRLKDSQSGMWVIRKSLLDKLTLRSDGMSFAEELKLEACHFARCRWKEVPIRYRQRIGKAKIHAWRDGTKNVLHLIRKRIHR